MHSLHESICALCVLQMMSPTMMAIGRPQRLPDSCAPLVHAPPSLLESYPQPTLTHTLTLTITPNPIVILTLDPARITTPTRDFRYQRQQHFLGWQWAWRPLASGRTGWRRLRRCSSSGTWTCTSRGVLALGLNPITTSAHALYAPTHLTLFLSPSLLLTSPNRSSPTVVGSGGDGV